MLAYNWGGRVGRGRSGRAKASARKILLSKLQRKAKKAMEDIRRWLDEKEALLKNKEPLTIKHDELQDVRPFRSDGWTSTKEMTWCQSTDPD